MPRFLVSRYDALRALARRKIGSSLRASLDATDLVQSVLGDALAAADQAALASTRTLKARLQRKAVDKLRRVRANEHLSDPGQVPSPWRVEGDLEASESRQLIDDRLDGLSDEERRCFELSITGHSWGAIAGETGLSVHQVGRRISSALKRLRLVESKVQ